MFLKINNFLATLSDNISLLHSVHVSYKYTYVCVIGLKIFWQRLHNKILSSLQLYDKTEKI